jgi:hypothetical protein
MKELKQSGELPTGFLPSQFEVFAQRYQHLRVLRSAVNKDTTDLNGSLWFRATLDVSGDCGGSQEIHPRNKKKAKLYSARWRVCENNA